MKAFLIRSGIIFILASFTILELIEPGYHKLANPINMLPWQKSEGNFITNFFTGACNKDQELPVDMRPYIGALSKFDKYSIPELKRLMGDPECVQTKDDRVTYTWNIKNNNLLKQMNAALIEKIGVDLYIRVVANKQDEIQSIAILK